MLYFYFLQLVRSCVKYNDEDVDDDGTSEDRRDTDVAMSSRWLTSTAQHWEMDDLER